MKCDGHRLFLINAGGDEAHGPFFRRPVSPSRNTPSAGSKLVRAGRSPGLRSRALPFDPRLPDS
ncbi:hypothetical protein UNPA324_17890 [Bradyrhizobium sp. UNPA324]|nr:hypothetical protein UNPA324_17890 [Bradyrhizobium sp. UNPA324]